VALAERAIDYFTTHLEAIPPNISLYIIPSLNPDSLYAPGELPGRLNGNGVDLNRNWDCRWELEGFWLATPVSSGSAPFSEPETISLRSFIQENNIAAVVFWFGSSSDGFVSPGACERARGSLVSSTLGAAYGQAAEYEVGSYEAASGNIFHGDATNWLDQEGIPSISVLLPGLLDSDWERNLAGMMATLTSYSIPRLGAPTTP
jgi:hypothetical protein